MNGVDLIQINVILVLIAAMRLLTQGFGNCNLSGIQQGYFQAFFYYRYTVVNTQSSIEFWNSIFFHNEFFHTTYESNGNKCEFPEICALDSVWKMISKVTELLIAIVHYLNQPRQCDLQPADCQTRLETLNPWTQNILASYTPPPRPENTIFF